jgi:hypothetical protein
MQDKGNVTGIRRIIQGHYNQIMDVVERYLMEATTLGNRYIEADEKYRRERRQKRRLEAEIKTLCR